MRAKVTLTKNFGIKTSKATTSKATTQDIQKMSILYPKMSKESYHHIKFRKSIMNRRCSIERTVL